jgi:nitric oxide reductase subunit C
MNRRRLIFYFLLVLLIPYNYLVYTRWTAVDLREKISNDAASGKQVWQKYNCISCHQLYGLGGYMGPDLTNVISGKGVAYTKALIQMGTGRMPAFEMSETERLALIAFLTEVDQSGHYPLKHYETHPDGTVNILKP